MRGRLRASSTHFGLLKALESLLCLFERLVRRDGDDFAVAVEDNDSVLEKHKLFGCRGVDKGPIEGLGTVHKLSGRKNGGNGTKECESFDMPNDAGRIRFSRSLDWPLPLFFILVHPHILAF